MLIKVSLCGIEVVASKHLIGFIYIMSSRRQGFHYDVSDKWHSAQSLRLSYKELTHGINAKGRPFKAAVFSSMRVL